jgi:hypothetical protein
MFNTIPLGWILKPIAFQGKISAFGKGKIYISNQFSYFNGQILLPNLSYAPITFGGKCMLTQC